MSWWRGRMIAFDLETTAADPQEARIVTAAVALVGNGAGTETHTWLVDPGVEIPEGATAVHGITTEQARADGMKPEDAVPQIAAMIQEHAGLPLVVFNAPYDLTVTDRELARLGLPGLSGIGTRIFVVDPFTIDKHLDRYRKGKRTLESQAAHYRASLDGAHDAAFDAIAAARVAWCLGARGEVIRRVRDKEEAIERNRLRKQWEAVRGDLPRLHEAQRVWALEERDRFAEYKRGIGETEEADRILSERGWPILEAPA